MAATWSRVSSGEGEALRLQAGAELVASLVCRADGSGLHAATDRFKPVMSEERFTIGAGDEAFTLVANLAADRAQGVEASGEIHPASSSVWRPDSPSPSTTARRISARYR